MVPAIMDPAGWEGVTLERDKVIFLTCTKETLVDLDLVGVPTVLVA